MVKAANDQEVEGFGSGATSIVEREGLNGTAVAGLGQIQRLIARIDAERTARERAEKALRKIMGVQPEGPDPRGWKEFFSESQRIARAYFKGSDE